MEQQIQMQTLLMAFVSLKKDMEDIKSQIRGKVPTLITEEALEGFRAYLKENVKPNTERSFSYLLGEFEKEFAGQNVPEIAPVRLQMFLAARWGKGKKSVLMQSLGKLKWLLGWCVKYVQIKGMPPFLNPCDLIEVKDEIPQDRPEFIPAEKMREFLSTAKNERHWLIFAILMTSGLRVSELIGDPRAGKQGLLKQDVAGRVLSITNPKSGRKNEVAVLPGWVEERLSVYMEKLKAGDRIFPVSYSTVYDVMRTHSKWTGLDIRPHDMRRWCATYWSRLHEYAMSNFILRHSSTKVNDATLINALGARYIAPLSVKEVIEKQDRLLVETLLAEVATSD